MKIRLLVLSFTIILTARAQKKETFYDFFWQPCSSENARYYSLVEKTDSGWLQSDYYVSTGKLQMQALYEDEARKIRNGYCYYFHVNGLPSIVGQYKHGKQEGICISYYSNGMIADSALFHNGMVTDKRLRWYRNGYMADSITRVNDSTEVQIGWFDDGRLAYAGFLIWGKQDGKWKYYHYNGQLSSTVVYSRGSKISAVYFDEYGKILTDTSNVNREATFKGGTNAWTKFLEKNLYWPAKLEFTTSATVTIGVEFAIDENGKIIDTEIYMPFHEEFDKIALKVINNSPPWLPAIFHNRKVKAYRRQPVTFSQSE